MKTYTLPHSDLPVSRIAYGCAGLATWDRNALSGDDVSKAIHAVQAAREDGITLFDHADVYCLGKCEVAFAQVLKQCPGLRDEIIIQSKCGETISEKWKPGETIGTNLSRENILRSVEASLRRLETDRLDVLLLHVADALMEPDEVAAAFEDLYRNGKVRHFGVSNYHGIQIELLKRSVRHPLVVNQIRLGLAYSSPLADGMENTLANAKQIFEDRYVSVAGAGTVDYCRLNDIQIQAWRPLRGLFQSSKDGKPELTRLLQRINDLAREKETTSSAVALAWLLRHPARIVPVIGSTNPTHIHESCMADRIVLTREEWYELFVLASAF
jgi:predicted oxidoreductase